MEIKKLGMSKYRMSDKNGGLFETNAISNALIGLRSDDVVIVINGLYDEEDKKWFNKNKKKIIFILTDTACVEKDKEVIDAADIVLHQSPNPLDYIKCRQTYGYVPELFFYEKIEERANQMDLCLFGGANTGRQELFNKYLFDEIGKVREKMFVVCKEYYQSGAVAYDDRLGYDTFMDLMSFFKYSLVIARKDYNEIGWVTPRYIEAVSRNCLPICDEQFDKYEHFKSKILVNSYDMLVDVIKYYYEHEDARIEWLNRSRETFKKNKDMFRRIVESEVY